MKTYLYLISALIVGVILAACSTATETPTEEPTAVPTTPVETIETASLDDIIDITWQWVETITPVGITTVEDPEKYTLELLPDGQFRITADCNSGSGSYTLEEGHISLEIGPMTRAECGPDSLDDEFLRDLGAAVIYFLEGANLYFDLMYDSGTMRFVPAG